MWNRSGAFDFQLRPVGCDHNLGPLIVLLRFKDFVANHEQGRVNLFPVFSFPKSKSATAPSMPVHIRLQFDLKKILKKNSHRRNVPAQGNSMSLQDAALRANAGGGAAAIFASMRRTRVWFREGFRACPAEKQARET